MVYILWIASLILLYYLLERRKKKRIEDIITFIKNMQDKDYRIPMKQDDFSILEDEIYKIFIEIVELEEKTQKNADRQVEYLEDIAHQIKTPITSMLFSVESLEMDLADNIDLQILKRQVTRLNSLSDILLKLSSLDANQELMKKERVNLRELVDYSLDTLNFSEDIEILLDDNLEDLTIYGDFNWLAEAIINIVKNAGNRPETSKIIINSESNPIFTRLSIIDNGGGVEAGKKKKIFKRFYKSPDSNGFGVGLAMAKTIVEKTNGEISVENNGKGADFNLKFYHVT